MHLIWMLSSFLCSVLHSVRNKNKKNPLLSKNRFADWSLNSDQDIFRKLWLNPGFFKPSHTLFAAGGKIKERIFLWVSLCRHLLAAFSKRDNLLPPPSVSSWSSVNARLRSTEAVSSRLNLCGSRQERGGAACRWGSAAAATDQPMINSPPNEKKKFQSENLLRCLHPVSTFTQRCHGQFRLKTL